ncbi:MAG: hypothetical protein CMJ64_00280 [Planctomycetaceae bacterium]|nr:hypothetical protein [Planctomycetaceae bacterium]
MWGGRSRWKIENKTFNTLKNQGYHFEHNFGHGHQHLSVVLAMLMMLAFLVDQTQQLGCPLFAEAWAKCVSKRALWESLREIFHRFQVNSMQAIYEALLSDRKPQLKHAWCVGPANYARPSLSELVVSMVERGVLVHRFLRHF